MFNLTASEVFVLLLLALIFVGPSKLPAMAEIFRGRRRRREMVPPVREVTPLSRLDWVLLMTGLSLAFGVSALLARR